VLRVMQSSGWTTSWLLLCLLLICNAFPKTMISAKIIEGRSIKDACGREVHLPTEVHDVALLTPTLPEYLFVTRQPESIRDWYKGNWFWFTRSHFRNVYPQLLETRVKAHVFSDIFDPELLMKLRPDVILDWDFRAPSFERYGLTSVCLSNRRSEEAGIFFNARLYAEVFDEPDRADALIASYRQALLDVATASKAAADIHQTKLLSISITPSIGRIHALKSPLRSEIVALAGGIDMRQTLPHTFEFLNAETVLLLDPDSLVLESNSIANDGPSAKEFLKDSSWQSLKAVRDRRVYQQPTGMGLFFTGIIETPLFARWIAEILHPDLAPEMREKMRNAYRNAVAYNPDDIELDHMLATAANSNSFDHVRFENHQPAQER